MIFCVCVFTYLCWCACVCLGRENKEHIGESVELFESVEVLSLCLRVGRVCERMGEGGRCWRGE